MIAAMVRIDDVNGLFSAAHPFDQEGIDDRTLLRRPHDERAGVKVLAKLCMSQRGRERHEALP